MTETEQIFAVAPMIDWTDRHCRYFHRLLSRRAVLYSEMVTTGAILFGDAQRHLRFNPEEQPVVLQLGGSDPGALAEAAVLGASYGYAAINLNVGCPSDRVQSGRFGACLMAEPELVARCLRAMADRVPDRPVTVKCRIGIDDQDSERDFQRFVDVLAGEGGVQQFIIHARKAWLQGLSPKENREIPPLDYDRVFRLKAARPDLTIILNGGLTVASALPLLAQVDGVMLGRAAYQDPSCLSDVDALFYGAAPEACDRFAIVEAMAAYAARVQPEGVPLSAIARPMMGLFNGWPGARLWRRQLSEQARGQASPDCLLAAADQVRRALAESDGSTDGVTDANSCGSQRH